MPGSAAEITPEDTEGEFAESVESFDKASAEIVERDEFSITYDGPDGAKLTQMSTDPLSVKVDGEWEPIETDVQGRGPFALLGLGGAEVVQHPLTPWFAENATESPLLRVADGSHEIGFSLIDARSSLMQRDLTPWSSEKDQITYPGVFENTDLRYEVTPSGVKELFVLSEKPGGEGRASWQWRIDSGGLVPRAMETGEIAFETPAGAPVLVMPRPIMWDSAGTLGDRANSQGDVEADVERSGDSWVLTLTAERSWLNSSKRVYPVSVDPELYQPATGTHAYKTNGQYNKDLGIQVGNTNESGTWRTLVHFNYEQLFGKQVLDVEIPMWAMSSDSTTTDRLGNLYHATNFSYNSTGEWLSYAHLWGSGTGLSDSDPLTNRIAQWVRGGIGGGWLVFTGHEVADFTYKHYRGVEMDVWWKEFPTPGTLVSPSPVNGSSNASLTPTLKVSGYTFPQGTIGSHWFKVSENPNPDVNTLWETGYQSSDIVQVPENKLLPGRTYYWKAWVADNYNWWWGIPSERGSAVWSFTTADVPRTDIATASPADKGVVVSTEPVLQVAAPANPAGRTLKYWFRVTTGSDTKTGGVLNSGWLATPSWPVPAGSLQDGTTYSWTVITRDEGYQVDSPTPWVAKFTVNKRLGAGGVSPADAVGPVSVNLASGNASVSFASPTVSTVGGPMGVSFSYNSQHPSNAGLKGEYFDATPKPGQAQSWDFAAAKQVLTRTDTQLSFQWGTASPGDGVPSDLFMARWTGFLTPNEAGDFYFGSTQDDGVAVTVGGTKVIDKFTTSSVNPAVTWSSAAKTLSIAPVAFNAEFKEVTGPAYFELWAKKGVNGTPFPVPASWFTKSQEILPDGWASSTILAGDLGTYTKARVEEGSITLIDATGGTHSFTKRSAGGYAPPAGESGTMTVAGDGRVTFTDAAGVVHVFRADGTIEQVTSPVDVKKPAAPGVEYSSTGLVKRVFDRLAAADAPRDVRFFYGGDDVAAPLTTADAGGSSKACPAVTGSVEAPKGMLCRIVYPGHQPGTTDTTRLFYDADKRLIGIQDPGGEEVGFTYDNRRLVGVRDGLQTDWLRADASRSASDANRTSIRYDSQGRATRVTLAAPDGADTAQQPWHEYVYGQGTTTVQAAGQDQTIGHIRTVTWDAGWRATSDTAPSGLTASTVWNSKDQVLSRTDPLGRMSTTIYDQSDRVTDTYGPAPQQCFGVKRLPTEPCPITPAHTMTGYDDGLTGLNAAWYDNVQLAGLPKAFTLGIPGVADGAINKEWAGGSPITGIPATGWSVLFTGTVTFPTAGVYELRTSSDDGSRVWVDDNLTVDFWRTGTWAASPVGVFTATAGQVARIRVQYFQDTGPSALTLSWKKPGDTAFAAVPGSTLKPAYNLATSSTTDDSVPAGAPAGVDNSDVPSLRTATSYGASPWLGLATQTALDPQGLNLRTTTGYADDYNRRTSRMLPAGVAAGATVAVAGTKYEYYGDTQTIANTWPDDPQVADADASVCGIPESTPQYGALKQATPPAAAGGARVVTQAIHDLWGRQVGSKRTGDTGWTCTSYDLRGRAIQTVYPGYADAAERTAVFDFAVGGNPLKSAATDPAGTITTTTDLLGRPVSYTDVWGVVTTVSYNLLGQAIQSTVTPPGGAASTTELTFNLDGQVETVTVDGTQFADPSYTTGELSGVGYSNGASLTAIQRNEAGATLSYKWAFPNGQSSVTDTVYRSQSGRIVANTLTDGATGYASQYRFDAAGRLSEAVIPGHTLTYEFAATGGCGVSAGAGLNGNRTSSTDTPTGGTAVTTAYCYDHTDRLTSTTVTGAAVGGGLNPVAAGIAASGLGYDAHGNTTKLVDQTLKYDVSDQHLSTALTDGTRIEYQRDVTGRIVARTETTGAQNPQTLTVRSGFTGGGDSPDLILDGANTVLQRVLGLPGGVTEPPQVLCRCYAGCGAGLRVA
ncbi:hypothetical protein J7E29_15015 [Streptomyces sp. ISL-90]|nr:hypothetical protein [Streptomyces sp. ISL-90]